MLTKIHDKPWLSIRYINQVCTKPLLGGKTIKALVLNGPGNLSYEENWPTPEAKNGWARISIKYCGICGSDIPRTMITGAYHHPLIVGHEFVGVIDQPAIGSGRFKEGDRVSVFPLIPCGNCKACSDKEYFHCSSYNFLGSRCDGAFAEYCLAPEANLFPVPENCDDRVGACIEPIAVALHMVKQSGFEPGNSALVIGAGPLGILTSQWLNILGASHVVLAGRSNCSLYTAKATNLEDVVSVNDKIYEAMKDFDYGFECAGSNNSLVELMRKVRRKGTITLLGRDTKDTVISLKDYEQFMRKEMTIKGCWGYNSPRDEGFIRDIIEEDKLKILPMITKEVALKDGADTLSRIYRKEEYNCKVLMKIR